MEIRSMDEIALLDDIQSMAIIGSQVCENERIAIIRSMVNDGRLSYNDILIALNSKQMNEGLLGSLLGGLTGLTLGKMVGEALANVLGVKQGVLYDLLTSRLVAIAIGSKIGSKI